MRSNSAFHAPDQGPPALRVCMLAYTFYENDGRVIRYAESLVQSGAEVDAIVLRRDLQPACEFINGVRVLRIQRREKNESGKHAYLYRILCFLVRSMVAITCQDLKKPYDVVHVHSVPDFEVFAAVLPKLRGAKVILDIHDIVPEFYAAKFNVEQASLIFKALTLVERLSASFANHVIAANDIWLKKITSRSAPAHKCSVFINYPDLSVFKEGLRTRKDDGKFIILYPGTLNWHQGVDLAVRAFARALTVAPNMEFHIYGEGAAKSEIQRLVDTLQLGDRVKVMPPMPQREIAYVMANADLGVVPKRDDGFGGEAFSTKILEFMALRVPLIVANTRIDTHYFDASIVRFFKAGDDIDLARAMADAYVDRCGSERMVQDAYEHAERMSWGRMQSQYLAIVKRLAQERRASGDAT